MTLILVDVFCVAAQDSKLLGILTIQNKQELQQLFILNFKLSTPFKDPCHKIVKSRVMNSLFENEIDDYNLTTMSITSSESRDIFLESPIIRK